jgi:hypothetical protein
VDLAKFGYRREVEKIFLYSGYLLEPVVEIWQIEGPSFLLTKIPFSVRDKIIFFRLKKNAKIHPRPKKIKIK